ncbi:DUF1996 domain-containing protein [Micromonospora sp. NBC_01813]|uniref:DUF1996 domain-containing protein n=1 Tax=Micromonospora sp. NBC_01813 TaxID=2975988 RepID=UPI002DDB6C35|nr:DUF1996 domain-containing protein [Micromonospora sp. NBC_01813]WSA07617.1 DUF1996 domain-containing protein [Micromonospora sp. NBC_01813]
MRTHPGRFRSIGTGKARAVTLSIAVATLGAVATVTVVSGGGRNTAAAEVGLDDFVSIQNVAPNVVAVPTGANASTGVFTVDCGVNENGKFSSDNPVAQPGISHGAEHLHDFVGNLAITADTSDEALAASDTTCRNGDRSSYFWPVVRIDRSVRDQAAADPGPPAVACPQVTDRLPSIPSTAVVEVRRGLIALNEQIDEANSRLASSEGIDVDRNNEVLDWLRDRRAETLKQLANELGRHGARPTGMVSMVDCAVYYGSHAGHTGGAPTVSPLATPTVSCPGVRERLPVVPPQASAEVDRNLDLLDRQIAEANERLVTTAGQGGPNFIDNAILGPLRDKRFATLDRIEIAIGRNAARPTNLTQLAGCRLLGNPGGGSDADGGDSGGGADQGGEPAELPVPSGPNLELPGNTGEIVRPAQVLIEYRGNATSKVTPMPRFLRALTGDSKPISRGPANARNSWTCSGFEDRLSDKYPICPDGSQVLRVHDFPGCWDGKNIDSENHRSHLSFPDAATGACPTGFVAIPQLRITIAYDIPQDVQVNGQYLLDSFPEEDHNPFSDHNDFINVNSEKQMRKIAKCINIGRSCR